MSATDGGPVFPLNEHGATSDGTQYIQAHLGMSLRDYIAVQAMGSFCAHLQLDGEDGPIWNPEGVALRCYALADAMLKARKP